jgi:hypothetical protein
MSIHRQFPSFCFKMALSLFCLSSQGFSEDRRYPIEKPDPAPFQVGSFGAELEQKPPFSAIVEATLARFSCPVASANAENRESPHFPCPSPLEASLLLLFIAPPNNPFSTLGTDPEQAFSPSAEPAEEPKGQALFVLPAARCSAQRRVDLLLSGYAAISEGVSSRSSRPDVDFLWEVRVCPPPFLQFLLTRAIPPSPRLVAQTPRPSVRDRLYSLSSLPRRAFFPGIPPETFGAEGEAAHSAFLAPLVCNERACWMPCAEGMPPPQFSTLLETLLFRRFTRVNGIGCGS